MGDVKNLFFYISKNMFALNFQDSPYLVWNDRIGILFTMKEGVSSLGFFVAGNINLCMNEHLDALSCALLVRDLGPSEFSLVLLGHPAGCTRVDSLV